jgi:hypothetical protein
MEASKVFTYQGLTTCTDVDTSWTIMSIAHNHVRHKKGLIEQGMERFIREEVDYQVEERPNSVPVKKLSSPKKNRVPRPKPGGVFLKGFFDPFLSCELYNHS